MVYIEYKENGTLYNMAFNQIIYAALDEFDSVLKIVTMDGKSREFAVLVLNEDEDDLVYTENMIPLLEKIEGNGINLLPSLGEIDESFYGLKKREDVVELYKKNLADLPKLICSYAGESHVDLSTLNDSVNNLLEVVTDSTEKFCSELSVVQEKYDASQNLQKSNSESLLGNLRHKSNNAIIVFLLLVLIVVEIIKLF